MSSWRESSVTPDGTHHLVGGRPLYEQRFVSVLKYHEPGLAPVLDESGAYHIDISGTPAYAIRFRRTFGFYQGLAAAILPDGSWLHIRTDGSPLSAERYRFCGNFQEGRSVVRDFNGQSFHINREGRPLYLTRHRYTGDYRDGCAVAQRADGRHSHIDAQGALVHDRWFLDLDVFHKGLARARDESGWHHVDRMGSPVYQRRFAMAEPYYNGLARVETDDGALLIIDETGETIEELRPAQRSALASLSADLVGFWRTQTLRAAVELGAIEALPGSLDDICRVCGLAPAMALRLLRALLELGLVSSESGRWQTTTRGELLRQRHPLTLAPAAQLWAGEHYRAWSELPTALRTGAPATASLRNAGWFQHIADDADAVAGYQAALTSYARHDYQALPHVLELASHRIVIDAGGGTGVLLQALLDAATWLRGVLLERPEVARLAHVPPVLAERCSIVAGDLLAPWPVDGDAIILARVLHDFDDEAAAAILKQTRRALHPGGRLYVVEMVLPPDTGQGGLLDLNMLVMTGGRERTRADFVDLLGRADLCLREIRPLPAVSSVLVAEAR